MADKTSSYSLQNLSENQVSKVKSILENNSVKEINSSLGTDGYTTIVGGSLRDALLCLTPTDIDIACALPINEIQARLERAHIKSIPTGAKHLTITAVINGNHFQVSSFRKLSSSKEVIPVSRPENQKEQLTSDLLLRDFTVNSFALVLNAPTEIIAAKNSLEHLENRQLATILSGDQCYSQDPLRLLRLLRLSSSHDLTITEQDIRICAHNLHRLRSVSTERIRDELSKILTSQNVLRGMNLLLDTGALQLLLPDVAQFVGFKQNRFHKSLLWEHTLEVVSKTPPDLILRWAALLHDVGKPKTVSHNPKTNDRNFFKHESVGAEMASQILKNFKYPNEVCESVRLLVQAHMRPTDLGDGGFRRLIRDLGEQFDRWRVLKEADASSTLLDPALLKDELEQFDKNIERIKEEPPVHPLRSLAVSGQDIIELGVKQGPTVGIILRALHEQVIDNPELNTRAELLKRAQRLIRTKPAKEILS